MPRSTMRSTQVDSIVLLLIGTWVRCSSSCAVAQPTTYSIRTISNWPGR